MTDETHNLGPPPTSPKAPTLEERVAALEAVVHAIAPYSRNAEHGTVVAWLEKQGARLKTAVEEAV